MVSLSLHRPHSLLYQGDSEITERHKMYQNSSEAAFERLKVWHASSTGNGSARLFANETANGICVGILATLRRRAERRHYLTQAIMSLASRVPLSFQNQVRLTIMNNNCYPNEFSEAQELSKYFHVVEPTYPTNISMQSLCGTMGHLKEDADYLSAMDTLYRQNCQYVLILEDDALAATNWYNKTMKAIAGIPTRYTNDWLCMKLYYSLRWRDWFSSHGAYGMVLIGVVFGTSLACYILIGLLMCFIIQRRLWKQTHVDLESLLPEKGSSHATQGTEEARKAPIDDLVKKTAWQRFCQKWRRIFYWPTVTSLFFLTANMLFIYFCAGRTNVFPMPHGPIVHALGYNMVSTLYPSGELPGLMSYFREAVQGYHPKTRSYIAPKDLFLSPYRKKVKETTGRELVEFLMTPSIFQHTGIVSSFDFKRERNEEELAMSYSFGDDNVPIQFEPNM